MSFEEGIDDPSDFQATAFQDLDEHFRCPICKEFFETTMILSTCSHSFCALCIRRSLNTEQNCPQCRKAAYESDLIHNYALDHVVNTWKNNRSFILTADRSAAAPTPPPVTTAPIQQHIETLPPPVSYNSSNSLPIIIDNDTSDDFVPRQVNRSNSAQPTATRRSNRLSSQTPKIDKGKGVDVTSHMIVDSPQNTTATLPTPIQNQFQNTTEQIVIESENEPLKSSSMVECPICTQHMALIVLNQHIDNCMKGDSRIPPLPSAAGSSSGSSISALSNLMPQKRKAINLGRKPSKVVYALMKEKDLKQALRELGLSDQGDKSTKIWRHKEYINLYNANYDSDNPVSASVLIQRLNQIEQLKVNDKNNQLKRKATDLDEHKQLYKSQFQELTENAKRNRMAKKSKEPEENGSTSAIE